MAALNFKDQETILLSSWLNGVNQLVYRIFLNPNTIDDVVLLLPEATQERKGLINGPDQEKVNDINSAFRVAELEVETISASRTLDNTDAYKLFRVNNASEVTITVPAEGSTSFNIGEYAYFEKAGSGNITFSPGPGVSVNTTTSLSVSDQYLIVGLIKVAALTWILFGNRQATEEFVILGIFDAPGILVYNTADFSRLPDPVVQPDTGVEGIAVKPDNNEMVILGDDTGQVRYSFPGLIALTDYPNVFNSNDGLAYSPDGSLISIGVSVYNTATEAKIVDLTVNPAFTRTRANAFSPDGSLLALGTQSSSDSLYVYETATWTRVPGSPTGITEEIVDIDFSPDGSLMLTGPTGLGVTALLYNTSDWSAGPVLPAQPFNPAKVAFNPDGSLIAIGSGGSPYLTLYRTSDFTKITGPTELPTDRVNGVKFNRDGSLLAVAVEVSPFLIIYNTSDFSKLPDVTGIPGGTIGQSVAFTN